jgi:hypothetical protein
MFFALSAKCILMAVQPNKTKDLTMIHITEPVKEMDATRMIHITELSACIMNE